MGGEFTGRGIDSGLTGNLFVGPVPGLLFVFKCRFGYEFPLDVGNVLKGEYLGLKLAGGGWTLGRIGLGA